MNTFANRLGVAKISQLGGTYAVDNPGLGGAVLHRCQPSVEFV